MQPVKNICIAAIVHLCKLVMLIVILGVRPCAAQEAQCRDSLNTIIQAYGEGAWNRAKGNALNYVRNVNIGKFNFFNDYFSERNAKDCISYLPQAYYYLIKSYIRLYDLDSARYYYKEALLKELEINFDTADSNTKQYFSFRRKQYSVSGYAGTSMNTTKYNFNYRIGLQYGKHNNFKLEAYGEASFSQRYFNHKSNERVGAFGKSLPYNPAAFPNYNFRISGRERFFDLLYFVKFPIGIPFFMGKKDNFKSYLSTGVYISYYINSSADSYRIYKNKSATDTTLYQSDTYQKSVSGLGMDLKRIYGNRLSYGLIYGYGVKFRMPRNWLMFAELRYTIGSNFKYKFDEFRDYKAGISYLTFLIGVRKNTNFLIDKTVH